MHEQLEFDLVSPFLADPTRAEMEKLRKILQLPPPATPGQFNELRGLAVRLNYLELVYDANSRTLQDEISDLAEVRVLIGESDWRKDKKLWTRRARKDPLRLRKIILSMKKSLGLT